MKGGEVIQLLRLLGSVGSKVLDVIKRDRKLKFDVQSGLQNLCREMRMATMDIDSSSYKNQGASHETMILLLKELALDIEDFIDTTWWVPGPYGLIFQLIELDPRDQILQKINNFKESVERVLAWKPDDDAGVGRSQQDAVGVAVVDSAPTCNPEAYIKTRADRVLDWLLQPAAQGQPPDLRVISIVGRHGVGKTALARAVYDRYSDQSTEYMFVAWVVASQCCNREDLLRKFLNNDHPASTAAHDGRSISHVDDGSSSISHVQDTNLGHFLQGKRYLVVIDDVDHVKRWLDIKDEFPDNGNNSRIIVTTSVHSIATECSRGCYVYKMHGLEETEAEILFSRIVGQENSSPALKRASDGILQRCGSLPLALSSAAHYLRRKGQAKIRATGGLTAEQCQCAVQELGDMVLNGKVPEFVRINRTLLRCFNGLPDYVHRSCLLYASVFPRGRSINSSVAIRKWIAEGLVAANGNLTSEKVANGCLDEFIDRSIVEPVLIRDARFSKFRVYSIMLEFIIHKAVSQNFVALVDQGELLINKETDVCARGQSTRGGGPVFGVRVRRLSVQNSRKEAVEKVESDINLSAIRSLTIYRSHILNMQHSKLLRVLDLGGCKGVNKEIVCRSICKLHFLKYLGLRGTDVVELPEEMQELENLETLDARDIGVDVVPIPIGLIRLSSIAHLLGRFELPPGITRETLKRSKLQTLAGVTIGGKAGHSFENIMLHARHLEKVKIYQTTRRGSSDSFPNKRQKQSCPPRGCAHASTSNSSTLLHLKGRLSGSDPLKVLSIDSSDLSTEFLSFLEPPCAIESIKLRGELDRLPTTVTLSQLVCLNRLLLMSTGLSSEDLSALQGLHYLEYLKLAEQSTGFRAGSSFVVHSGGFPSLKRLCFEAQNHPQMIFLPGSLQSLAILDLFCPNPDNPGLGVQGISNLPRLNEVILHHSTEDKKMQAWNDIAIRHNNKPAVKRQAKPR